MEFSTFITGKDDENRRLDKVIRKMLTDENLSSIYKAIRKGLIKVNQKKTSAEYKIQEGDCIKIASFLLNENFIQKSASKRNNYDKTNNKNFQLEKKLSNNLKNDITNNIADGLLNKSISAVSEKDSKTISYSNVEKATEIKIQPANINFKTIIKNQYIWIINKPFGLCVQGTQDSLDKMIQNEYENSSHKKSLSFKPGPLHRLDKKTTGLLAFSQNLSGARWFSKNIQNHSIQKTYIGIAQGHLNKKVFWSDLINENTKKKEKKSDFKTVEINCGKPDESKEAHTTASPLIHGTYNGYPITLIRYDIKTGRHHQIRSQSAFHGFPLLGDTAYGGLSLRKNDDLFFLHAWELRFPENDFNIPLKLNASFPDSFISFIKKYFNGAEPPVSKDFTVNEHCKKI